jgi:hypothetical protein
MIKKVRLTLVSFNVRQASKHYYKFITTSKKLMPLRLMRGTSFFHSLHIKKNCADITFMISLSSLAGIWIKSVFSLYNLPSICYFFNVIVSLSIENDNRRITK